MGKTGCGEDRKFLPTYQGVQSVNGGNPRLNKFRGVVTCGGIDRGAVDVRRFFRNQTRAAVDRFAHAVEHTPEHVRRNRQFHPVSRKTHLGLRQIESGGGVEKLHQHVPSVDLQNAAPTHLAVRQFNLAQFVVLDALHLLDQHQRSGDFFYGSVFSNHFGSSFPRTQSFFAASTRASS